jgi:hypothetical protein
MNKIDKKDARLVREELTRLTESFCQQYLDNEYRMLIKKIINKLSRKKQVPYLSGRVEIWAGAIIHAIGSINFLFDQSFNPCSTASRIAEYFGTSTSTLGQKARLIRDMLKLHYWHPEFSTKHMLDKNPFADLAVVNGFIIPLPRQ